MEGRKIAVHAAFCVLSSVSAIAGRLSKPKPAYCLGQDTMVEQKINLKLLIENCRKGNRNSQRKLYEHFYGFGMKIALRYAANKDEALEILNDGFLKVFLKLNQYDSDLPFKPWFGKILVNASIDYHRSRQGYGRYVELSAVQELSTDQSAFPEITPHEDILPIVQQLPPAYRLVFNLFVMEGYKHREIAQMLDISISTSKSNLTRAKEKLRTLLFENRQARIAINAR